jgi:hypothetical protein
MHVQHMEKVVVKDSPIHGKGVFASRRIEPGEVINEGCRETLTDEAVKALPFLHESNRCGHTCTILDAARSFSRRSQGAAVTNVAGLVFDLIISLFCLVLSPA